MANLVLDLLYYRPGSWSAEVSVLESDEYIASATGATADEVRDAVLAQLTPEQLADLRESMIGDLAAVAKAMGYECTPHDDLAATYNAEGVLCGSAVGPGQCARHLVLGYALAINTLRRDQEAESRDTEREGE